MNAVPDVRTAWNNRTHRMGPWTTGPRLTRIPASPCREVLEPVRRRGLRQDKRSRRFGRTDGNQLGIEFRRLVPGRHRRGSVRVTDRHTLLTKSYHWMLWIKPGSPGIVDSQENGVPPLSVSAAAKSVQAMPFLPAMRHPPIEGNLTAPRFLFQFCGEESARARIRWHKTAVQPTLAG